MPSGKYKPEACWKKNRIAARIILRKRRNCLQPRDIRVARALKGDPAITDRLIDQALHSLQAPKKCDEVVE